MFIENNKSLTIRKIYNVDDYKNPKPPNTISKTYNNNYLYL